MKVAILIDGGFLRAQARVAHYKCNPDFIEKFALKCVAGDETLLRILYYDCAPYSGTGKRPISGSVEQFSKNDQWLKNLAARDLFAVRRGELKFRGYKPKKTPLALNAPLSDNDFRPDFEQKGVDMRIGLDIASYSTSKHVDRIILVSGDTDCIPAMKHGRKAGLQIVLVKLQNSKPAPELLWHCDFQRQVGWP